MNNPNDNLSAQLERSRMAAKLSFVAAFLALAMGLVVYFTSAWGGIGIYQLTLIPLGLALLFSILTAIQSSLSSNALAEEEEKMLLEKRKENVSSILDISEDVRFTAARTLVNFKKYVPPAITLLCFLSTAGAIVLFWRAFFYSDTAALGTMVPKNPVNLAFTASVLMIINFFAGVFLVGQSHVKEYRWLRPCGAWMITAAVMMLLTGIAALLIATAQVNKEVHRMLWEIYFLRAAFVVLALLSLEFLCSFVIEFYRPRTASMEDRPVYESRLLALFMEPGGLVRNIAETLDYQFGFKISKTSLYGVFERSIIPALMVWVFVLWLFTAIAEVNPGELGIRERFGAFVGNGTEVLQPGIHVKLPWPFEKIVRVPVDIVQDVVVGTVGNSAAKATKENRVVLWTGQHYQKEEGFLVASEKMTGSQAAFPVSILEAALHINYIVKQDKVYDYAFRFRNVGDTLKLIGESEATAYFASTDFLTDISSGREQVSQNLTKRVQKCADELQLGVKVVSVNMHDAHPPVSAGPEDKPDESLNVAAAFQDVFCASSEMETMKYEAEAYAVETIEETKVQSQIITASAAAYQFDVSRVAAANAFRFKSQLAAYRAMPAMFQLRTYLDFLEQDCAHMRKYIISANIPSQIYELNLEEKPRLDLLDADLGQLGK